MRIVLTSSRSVYAVRVRANCFSQHDMMVPCTFAAYVSCSFVSLRVRWAAVDGWQHYMLLMGQFWCDS